MPRRTGWFRSGLDCVHMLLACVAVTQASTARFQLDGRHDVPTSSLKQSDVHGCSGHCTKRVKGNERTAIDGWYVTQRENSRQVLIWSHLFLCRRTTAMICEIRRNAFSGFAEL
nr:hypothetical protein CFP56_13005 [Quercus suber]